MNKPVRYTIAKLLKEKGFKESTKANWYILSKDHSENYNKGLPVDESKIFFAKDSYELSNIIEIDEDTEHQVFHFLAVPTIADVVMWLLEKHKIWIWIGCRDLENNGKTIFIANGRNIPSTKSNGFVVDIIPYQPKDNPSEAYESAIEYTLNNLI
jgi:hypothetical protein